MTLWLWVFGTLCALDFHKTRFVRPPLVVINAMKNLDYRDSFPTLSEFRMAQFNSFYTMS
jgi:hypothetical protein